MNFYNQQQQDNTALKSAIGQIYQSVAEQAVAGGYVQGVTVPGAISLLESNASWVVQQIANSYPQGIPSDELPNAILQCLQYILQNSQPAAPRTMFGGGNTTYRNPAARFVNGRQNTGGFTPPYPQNVPQVEQVIPPRQQPVAPPRQQTQVQQQPIQSHEAPVMIKSKKTTETDYVPKGIKNFNGKPQIGKSTAVQTAFEDATGRAVILTYDYQNIGKYMTPEEALAAARMLTPTTPKLRIDIVEYERMVVLPYKRAHIIKRLESLTNDITNSGCDDDRFGFYRVVLENLKHGEEPGACELFKQLMKDRFNLFAKTGAFLTTQITNNDFNVDGFDDIESLLEPSDIEEIRAVQQPDGFYKMLDLVCQYSIGGYLRTMEILNPNNAAHLYWILRALNMTGDKSVQVSEYMMYDIMSRQDEGLTDNVKEQVNVCLGKLKKILEQKTVITYPAVVVGTTLSIDDSADTVIINTPTNVLDYVLKNNVPLENYGIADLMYTQPGAMIHALMCMDIDGDVVTSNNGILG